MTDGAELEAVLGALRDVGRDIVGVVAYSPDEARVNEAGLFIKRLRERGFKIEPAPPTSTREEG